MGLVSLRPSTPSASRTESVSRSGGLVAALALVVCLAAAPLSQGDVQARFETLTAAAPSAEGDAAIAALWREHPGETLSAIDSFLEGSLARREREPAVAEAEIVAMEARALRGAKAADLVFGTAIFGDYASSFASWNAEDARRFRQGQALYGEAAKALAAKDFALAGEKARASLELAEPLGDHWGSAMALSALGRVELAQGAHAAALTAAGRARLLNHELRLEGSELGDLDTISRAAEALGRRERALVAAEAGAALAARLHKADAEKQFRAAIARLSGSK